MAQFDVSIAGEINMDMVLYGLQEDLPLDRELLATGFQATLGGSSAILAHNLAVLGKRVGFITRVGPDEMGGMALDRLAASGVDLSQAIRAKGPTSTGVTVLLHHGVRRRMLTYPGTMGVMSRADLDFDYLASARHFHLSSLFLQTALAPDLPALFRDLKQAGLTISLDTNDDPAGRWEGVLDDLLDHVDVLLPNEEEACRIARRNTVEEALLALSQRVPCIAAKCGARGALVQTGGKLTEISALSVDPVDTIGAGDSFNAGFLAAFVEGASPVQCAFAGNITGALSTLRPGGTEAFRDLQLRDTFLQKHDFHLSMQNASSRNGE
jgi:sugar/nucleoside kinase (ribokinase family)